MSGKRTAWRVSLALSGLVALAASASATTLIREGLDELVSGNQTIVLAEVIDAVSYWNSDGTFILTDVTVKPMEVLKGRAEGLLTVTLMGGTVGDLTTLIVGGAEIIPGRSYVLFLNEENLPGSPGVTTVRDHCQGVYDISVERGELRAVSQANRHPLVPDRMGYLDAPGGVEGFPLEAMVQSLREMVARDQEVNR